MKRHLILLILCTLALSLSAESRHTVSTKPEWNPIRIDFGLFSIPQEYISASRGALHTELSFPTIQSNTSKFKCAFTHFGGVVGTRSTNDTYSMQLVNLGSGCKFYTGKNMSYVKVGYLRGSNGVDAKQEGFHGSLGFAILNKGVGIESSLQRINKEESITISIFFEIVNLIKNSQNGGYTPDEGF